MLNEKDWAIIHIFHEPFLIALFHSRLFVLFFIKLYNNLSKIIQIAIKVTIVVELTQ